MTKKRINNNNELGNLVQNLHQFKETDDDIVSVEIYQDGSFCIRRLNENEAADINVIMSSDKLTDLIELTMPNV